MKHFHKIMDGVDVSQVNAQLAANPELWNQISARTQAPGTPHRTSSDIWVRYNDIAPFIESGDFSKINDEHVPVWYEAWEKIPALRPIVFAIMAEAQGEMIGGVLITKIPAGRGIDPHIDVSWHVDYYDKFYLSLESSPGAEFICHHDGEREALSPVPGEVWLFDNHKLHSVENKSGYDRVTLIVCIRTEKYSHLKELT